MSFNVKWNWIFRTDNFTKDMMKQINMTWLTWTLLDSSDTSTHPFFWDKNKTRHSRSRHEKGKHHLRNPITIHAPLKKTYHKTLLTTNDRKPTTNICLFILFVFLSTNSTDFLRQRKRKLSAADSLNKKILRGSPFRGAAATAAPASIAACLGFEAAAATGPSVQ